MLVILMVKRLIKDNHNTAEEYNDIFYQRVQKGLDEFDLKRWKRLIKGFKGGSILDVGCLDSQIYPILNYHFLNQKLFYTGIDIAEQAIESMKKQYPLASFLTRDLYQNGFKDNEFDYVVMGEVLEHLEEPEKAIRESMRVLKSGGMLALSVPLNEEKEFGAVDGHHHLWSYSVDDIVGFLKPYGKVKIETMGSQYFPKYKYHWPNLIAFCRKK